MDEVLVGVAAEIAVRILELHEAVAFVADKREELLVLKVVRHARRGEHLLAPELAAPEPAHLGFVVITELERLARLVEHLVAHEGIDESTGDETIHLLAQPSFKAHVPKRRTAHGVLHSGVQRKRRNKKHES